MKRKIIAFYDLLLITVVCLPLTTSSVLIFIFGELHDLYWLLGNFHLLVLFAVGIVLPIALSLCVRYTEISNNDAVYFHYFPHGKTWKDIAENIDIRWNQNLFISEVATASVVKLTEEEKRTKVYYKHWFNKYLKIYLKYGSCKYVYVGNYANFQIEKMIALLEKR